MSEWKSWCKFVVEQKKYIASLIKGQTYSSNANTHSLGIDEKYFINLAEVKAVTSFFLWACLMRVAWGTN